MSVAPGKLQALATVSDRLFDELPFFDQLGVALANLFLLVVYLNIPLLLYAAYGFVLPKYTYALFTLLTLPWFFAASVRPALRVCAPFLVWVALFSLINLAYLQFGTVSMGETATKRLQHALFAIPIVLWVVMTKAARWRPFVVLAIVVHVLAVLLDLVAPGKLYPKEFGSDSLERPTGLFQNANEVGQALLLLCALYVFGSQSRGRTALLIVTGLGIFLSFSRGNMLGWFFLVVISAYFLRITVGAFVCSVAVVAFFLVAPMVLENRLTPVVGTPGGATNLVDRLEAIARLDLRDESADERVVAARRSVALFMDQPLFGGGTGETDRLFGLGPHNQFLIMAAEYGAPGIVLSFALMLIILVRTMARNRELAIAICGLITILSMFSHTILDIPYWYIAFALIVAPDGERENL